MKERIIYSHIFPEEIEYKFFKIYRTFQKYFGCTYMSYICEHTISGEKFVFQTNPDWANIYVGENFMANCPLLIKGKELMHKKSNNDIMFLWDTIPCTNQKQKIVMDARKDLKIFHGLSASKEYGKIRQMFGMATEEKNNKFLSYVLKDIEIFSSMLYVGRTLANNFVIDEKKWKI